MLSIMRTSDLLENRLARLLRQHGLTLTQYNVLRILRGEAEPMACLEIASRMIQVAPAITRVIDQLLSLELISKTQSDTDRRVFRVAIQPKATKLLLQLDEPVQQLHRQLMHGLSPQDLNALLTTLLAIREVADTISP